MHRSVASLDMTGLLGCPGLCRAATCQVQAWGTPHGSPCTTIRSKLPAWGTPHGSPCNPPPWERSRGSNAQPGCDMNRSTGSMGVAGNELPRTAPGGRKLKDPAKWSFLDRLCFSWMNRCALGADWPCRPQPRRCCARSRRGHTPFLQLPAGACLPACFPSQPVMCAQSTRGSPSQPGRAISITARPLMYLAAARPCSDLNTAPLMPGASHARRHSCAARAPGPGRIARRLPRAATRRYGAGPAC